MRKIAVVYGGNSHHHRTYTEPKYRQYIAELIYFPNLQQTSLDSFDVLLLPSQLHKGLLEKSMSIIYEFAERGGIVVSFGPQPCNWIPKQDWEYRETNFWWWLEKEAKSGLVLENPNHDLFTNYLTLADATWHQHGVYWPSAEVDVLVATEDGGAVLYIDKVSTKGTWVVTTLDPDHHYGSYFMPATERFLDGFFPWLMEGQL